MPRFSETSLLDRLIVPAGKKIKGARDFVTSWKEGVLRTFVLTAAGLQERPNPQVRAFTNGIER